MSEVTIPQAFALALRHYRAGQLAEAEAFCRQILTVQPGHADSLHLLGIIAHRSGRHELAVDWIRQSIARDPNQSAAHSNLGEAYRALRRLDEAFASYHRALQLNPNDALTHYNLGLAFGGLGRWDDAIAANRQALALQPDYADAHNNLGAALCAAGQLAEAVDAYRHALELHPEYAEAHNNLGNALRDQGQLTAALAAYRRALELQPHYPVALNNLGNALQECGQFDEALACYLRALDLQPAFPEVHNNLGNLLRRRGQLDQAITAYDQALALRPSYGEAAFNLGNARKDRGELDAAAAAYRRAIQIMPGHNGAWSGLLLLLHYLPHLEQRTIAAEHQHWNRQISEPLHPSLQPHLNDRSPDRRLRIGYVSADFRDHVVGRNLRPLFRCHNHQDFEILCYSGVTQPDNLTEEFRQCSAAWRSTVGLADEALAALIRQDGVDILVDLAQHTAGNRLPVLARRPAPVQVSFAGYPASTGLEAIGYRISDGWLESEMKEPAAAEMEDRSSEFGRECGADLRSPNSDLRSAEQIFTAASFWCYDPCGMEIAVNALPARTQGYITFGSLNNFCKVNEPVLKLWARVLGQVDNSRLILLSGFGSHRQHALEILERAGLDPHRVEFVESHDRRAYLELYHRLDVALDPFPYNGHTTSLDALWMGVPVVTLAGHRSVSRAGLSQLSNLGLPELAASSEEDYIRIAVELTRDLPRLAALRATLRSRMEASVLMDAPRFAQQIETAYRTFWRQWCAAPPA